MQHIRCGTVNDVEISGSVRFQMRLPEACTAFNGSGKRQSKII